MPHELHDFRFASMHCEVHRLRQIRVCRSKDPGTELLVHTGTSCPPKASIDGNLFDCRVFSRSRPGKELSTHNAKRSSARKAGSCGHRRAGRLVFGLRGLKAALGS